MKKIILGTIIFLSVILLTLFTLSGKTSLVAFTIKHPELVEIVRNEYEIAHKKADEEIIKRHLPVATESAEKK